MDILQLGEAIDDLIGRWRDEGYSVQVIGTAEWVLNHFRRFCILNCIEEVGPPAIEMFLRVQFDLSMDARCVTPTQCSIRKPLLALWEIASTGEYLLAHRFGKRHIPRQFLGFFKDYAEFIGGLGNSERTVEVKTGRMRRFLEYLDSKGVERMEDLTVDDVYGYLGNGERSWSLLKSDACMLREALDWMSERGTVGFGGRDALPAIKANGYSPLPSYYTSDEVARMLATIDTSTKEGKRDMLVMSLFAYYGLRCGDVVRLEFGNVDWAVGRIELVQDKTGAPLSLPLIDEVKFPLLDYAKNARPESDDRHILLKSRPPYGPYPDGRALHSHVTRVMEAAGIDTSGRHHGPHALRHSLASSMLEAEVPLPTIGGVLGHANTGTTEVYLSIDERQLASLALEVPHVAS